MGKRVAVVLSEGFADWEYGLIGGVGGGHYGLEMLYATPRGEAVMSLGGLRAAPGNAFDQIEDFNPAVVCVIGGAAWESESPPDLEAEGFVPMLKRLHGYGASVAGICGGTLALARAGLLDDCAHVSNGPEFLSANAPNYSGEFWYQDKAHAVSDRRIITAPGSAPVTFAYEVFTAARLDDHLLKSFASMMLKEHDDGESRRGARITRAIRQRNTPSA